MAVAYRSSGTIVANGEAGVDMSSNLPSGLAIDDIMIFVGMDADNEHFDLAMPTGWTAIYSNNSQGNLGGTIAWKRYDGTETDWQFDTPSVAGQLVCGVIHAFSGAIKVGDPTATRGATPSVSARTTHSASYDPLVDADTTKLKVHFIIVEDNVAVTDVSDALVTVHDNQTTTVGSDGRLILGSSTALQNTSTDGMIFTSGSEYSYNGTFDLTPDTNRPTIVPNTADAHDFGADDTPTLEFTGSDANNDDLEYQLRIFSAIDTDVDKYVESNQSTSVFVDGNYIERSHSFTGNGDYLTKIKLYLKSTAAITGKTKAYIYAHSGTFGTSSLPTGNPLATSDVFDVSALTTSFVLTDFNFDGTFELVNGTKYCLVIERGSISNATWFEIGADNSSPTHGGNSARNFLGSWSTTAEDLIFYVEGYTLELDKLSETPELEFLNTVSGGDTHPFNSGEKISYTVQTEPLLDSYPSSNQDNETSFINAYTAHSQSFKSSSQQPQDLTKTTFQLRKTGSPTGNATAQLFAHSGTFGTDSAPTGSALATSDNFDVSTLTTSFALIDFIFSTPYTVQPNTNYCIVLEHIANDGTNYMLQARDTSSPTHQGNANYYNGTWIEQSAQDLIFYNYYASEALAEGTYYWRARAQDPLGTAQWSDWTTIRSFDVGGFDPNASFTATALNADFAIVEPTVSVVSNISFTATALTAAFAVVAPMVGISVNETPAPVNASFAIVEPTVTAEQNANFDATALISNFSIVEPVVTAIQNVDFTPGVLTANVAIVEPTVTTVTSVNFDATQIPVNFAIVEPSVSLGASFTATPLSNAFAIQEPVINIDTTINPGLLTNNFAILEPTIVTATPANFDATVIPVNFAIQEPTLILDCIFSVAQIPASFAIVEPAVNIDAGYTASQIPVNFTIVEPTVQTEVIFTANQIPVNFAIQEPTVQADAIHTAAQIPVNFAIVEPAVNIDAGFTAAILNNSFAVVEPVVTGELNALIEPTVLNGALAIVEPTVSGVSNFTANLLSSSFGIIEPVVTAEVNVNFDAPLLGSSFSIQEPVVSLPVIVTPTIISKTPVTVSQASYDSTNTSNNTNLVGQSFFVAGFDILAPDYIDFVLYAQGSPNLDIRAYIYSLDGSNNLNALLSTSPTIIAASSLTGTPANYRFFFDKAIYTENIAIVLDWINVGTNNGGNKVHFHYQSTDLYANGNYIANSTANAVADAAFTLSIAAYNFIIVQPTVEIGVVRFYAPVLNSSFAIIAPQVQDGVDDGFTATQLPINFTVQEPTVTGESNFVATEIPVNFSVVEPVVSIDSGFNAPLLNASFTISEPSIKLDSGFTPTPLSAIFGIQEPAVSGEGIFTSGLLQSTFAIVEPTVQSDANIQISALASVLNVIEPSVSAGGNVQINVSYIDSVFQIQEPTVSADSNVAPGAVNASFGIVEPGVNIDSNILAAALSATFAIQEPTVSAGGNIEFIATALNVSFGIVEPAINIDVETVTNQVSATFAIQEPTVDIPLIINPAAIGLVFEILEPTISTIYVTPTETIDEVSQITISIIDNSVICGAINENSYLTTTLTLKSILDG